ncbi:MAG: cation-transporting P-type ATPase, partial [Anaerolineae bacterium]|nr:cation-transporting P-type ATPase [Anaerolineae bacterium]
DVYKRQLWQEYRAEMAVAALRKVLPVYARVVRVGTDGTPQETQIPAEEVVPGDVLVLTEGEHIPADARVVEEHGLRINHAVLTGDAVPMRKTAEASLIEGITELERPNLVFAGTSVVSGSGRAVVFATGMSTQLGRIARLSQAIKEPPSAIYQDIYRLTRILAAVAITAGLAAFLVGISDIGMSAADAFLFAIGIMVAVTPEGLLPTVTLSLAMAVQRLARLGVLVKKPAVVDTLGKTSVLCIDKSGTLTQNRMTACRAWVGGQQFAFDTADDPGGPFSPACPFSATGDLAALLVAAERCNNSRLVPPSPGRPMWGYLGDQTEAALRVLALRGCLDVEVLERTYPRVHELPFDARRKRMTTIHRDGASSTTPGALIAFVKGAPREVLQCCTHILINGTVQPLDHALRAEILAVTDEYARNALRVLALARRTLDDPAVPRAGTYTPEWIERDLTFLGLVAMTDPPRPEVAGAVQKCHDAGIRLVMVTGDYGLTAESLARRVGIIPATARPRIVNGADMDSMSDAELRALLESMDTLSPIIFARMAPEHKLRLVAAFQSLGEVVTVIGDGVNDAPALRKSDVGIAMGVSGAYVAREAADIILTNDNFAAIVEAIAEGRAVYDNIRKFITYILISNVPEVVPFALRALLRIPLALTVPQILAVDLGTDLLPALALSTEAPELDVMQHPPRRRRSLLLDRSLALRVLGLGAVETALCYAGFLWVFHAAGYTDLRSFPPVDLLPFSARLMSREGTVYALATTVFHAGLVTAQVGSVLACRRMTTEDVGSWIRNRALRVGIAVEILLILLLIYFPPLAVLFEHQPLPWWWWGGLILYAPALYGLHWLFRAVFVARKRREVG